MYYFSDGFVCIKKDGKFGFVDLIGEMCLVFSFLVVIDFYDGLVVVVVEDVYGLID